MTGLRNVPVPSVYPPGRRISVMPEFVTVATVADIPPGTGRTVEVQGVWIALFNVGGSFYAVDNTCP
ncbi:MAG: Rieske 2Fe-2S domain-containing protein, partial [Nitrospirae bacterium]|nr:Rieske 2Fe-2S domain-containing protein [Nitrospirota bacterium]